MNSSKRVLNILGIIVSAFLSVVLVLLLILSTISFSALSLLKPEQIAAVVTNIDFSEQLQIDSENSQLDAETIDAIMSSSAAKEVVTLYATDLTNALGGKEEALLLDAESLKKIVNKNLDEIVEIVQELKPSENEMSDAEVENAITEMLEQESENIIQALPTPAQITQNLENESNKLFTNLINAANNITTVILPIVCIIALISGLIFVCRLFEFKGFKWLAINHFIASVFSGIAFVFLLLLTNLETLLNLDNELIGVISTFVSRLRINILIRNGVVLLFGVGFLIAYIFIKKAAKKKAPITTEPNTVADLKSSTLPSFETDCVTDTTEQPTADTSK